MLCCDAAPQIETKELLIGCNMLSSYANGRYKAGAPIAIVLPLPLRRRPPPEGELEIGRATLHISRRSAGHETDVRGFVGGRSYGGRTCRTQ
jgi:hypothetical protein